MSEIGMPSRAELRERFGDVGVAILELQRANHDASNDWPASGGIELVLHSAAFGQLRDAINQHTTCDLPDGDEYTWNANRIKRLAT